MCVATSIIVETFFEIHSERFPVLIWFSSVASVLEMAGGGFQWSGRWRGGVAGAVIYFLMIELHHPELEKNLEDDNSIKDKYEFSTVN